MGTHSFRRTGSSRHTRSPRRIHSLRHRGTVGAPIPRWVAIAGWAALLLPLPSIVWRLAMLSGIDMGFRDAALYRDSAEAAIYVLGLDTVQVLVALLCFGLIRPWSETAPLDSGPGRQDDPPADPHSGRSRRCHRAVVDPPVTRSGLHPHVDRGHHRVDARPRDVGRRARPPAGRLHPVLPVADRRVRRRRGLLGTPVPARHSRPHTAHWYDTNHGVGSTSIVCSGVNVGSSSS